MFLCNDPTEITDFCIIIPFMNYYISVFTYSLSTIFFSILINSQTFEDETIITNGLIAYYTFHEGSLEDFTGNILHDASQTGSPTVITSRLGFPQSSYLFDGQNDYLSAWEVTNTLAIAGFLPYSISLWVYPMDATSGAIIGFNINGVNRNHLFWSHNGQRRFEESHETNQFIGSPQYSINEWYHIVWILRVGGSGNIYVNNNNDVIFSGADTGAANRFSIGQEYDNSSPSDFFYGRIDDVRVYNRVLNEGEIDQLYKFCNPTLKWIEIPENQNNIYSTERFELQLDVDFCEHLTYKKEYVSYIVNDTEYFQINSNGLLQNKKPLLRRKNGVKIQISYGIDTIDADIFIQVIECGFGYYEKNESFCESCNKSANYIPSECVKRKYTEEIVTFSLSIVLLIIIIVIVVICCCIFCSSISLVAKKRKIFKNGLKKLKGKKVNLSPCQVSTFLNDPQEPETDKIEQLKEFLLDLQVKIIPYEKIKLIKYLERKIFLGHYKCDEKKKNKKLFIYKSFPEHEIINMADENNRHYEEEFKNEVEVSIKAKHRNVIGFYGVVLQQSNIVVLTEYGEYGDLMNIVRNHRGLIPMYEKIRFLKEISEGMKFLHEKKFTHRDLKLKNVVLDADAACKIIDFGLTKVLNNKRNTLGIGTELFMSPEMMSDKENYDRKIDQFGFAIMMYILLTEDVNPYKQITNSRDICLKVSKNPQFRPDVAPLRQLVDDEIITLIESCWSFDSKVRPEFKKISHDLERYHKTIPQPKLLFIKEVSDKNYIEVVADNSKQIWKLLHEHEKYHGRKIVSVRVKRTKSKLDSSIKLKDHDKIEVEFEDSMVYKEEMELKEQKNLI